MLLNFIKAKYRGNALIHANNKNIFRKFKPVE